MGHLMRGLLAGGVGTVCMDLVWYARYRRQGGKSAFVDWESSAGLDNWADASAPAKVGKLLVEATSHHEPSPRYARLFTNAMHWGYGLAWGGLFGLAIGCPRNAGLRQGLLLGAGVWGASYVALPIAGVYQPIWTYSPRVLWADLSAHLVFGLGVASANRARVWP